MRRTRRLPNMGNSAKLSGSYKFKRMQCPNRSYIQLILLALLLALSSCNKNTPQANNDQASVRQPSIDFGDLQRLYDYERNAPLDLKEHLSEDKNGLKRWTFHISVRKAGEYRHT